MTLLYLKGTWICEAGRYGFDSGVDLVAVVVRLVEEKAKAMFGGW